MNIQKESRKHEYVPLLKVVTNQKLGITEVLLNNFPKDFDLITFKHIFPRDKHQIYQLS